MVATAKVIMTTPESEAERKRELDRERGRRYRARHPDRVKAAAKVKTAKYSAANPDKVKASQQRSSAKARSRVNSDPYSAVASASDRFWQCVDASGRGCWEWLGRLTPQGYGAFTVAQRRFHASRASLILKLGRNLANGLFALHTCDNPKCCNPEHLYEGTQKQNMRDKVQRDRHVARSGHKITEDIAMKILGSTGTQKEIAGRFNVSQSMVSMVKGGSRWGRLAQPRSLTLNGRP